MREADHQAIRRVGAVIERELPAALDRLYDRIGKTPEIRGLFGSGAAVEQAKRAQRAHWKSIAAADLGAEYVARVHAIGAVHARIGLEPAWYIGSYAIVIDHLVHAIVADALAGKGRLSGRRAQVASRLANTIGSLCKAVFLEMDLTISVYLDEAEQARQAARDDAIRKEQELVAGSFGAVIGRIAQRDLSGQVRDDLPPAYLTLRDDLNAAMAALSDTLGSVHDTSRVIDSAAAEISNAAHDLAGRTERQAASVEQTAATVEQVGATVARTAARVAEAEDFVAQCQEVTGRFGGMIAQARASMDDIAAASDAIGRITDVMDAIATRTHLLALNTGIEAARAGEAGNSFKILAKEIRDLASRAAEASHEVRSLVGTSRAQVATGVAVMGEAHGAIGAIIAGVEEIGGHLKDIAVAAREQEAALHDINGAVAGIDRGTRQNAAMAERTSAASTAMAGQAAGLKAQLAEFRLGARPSRGIATRAHFRSGGRSPISAMPDWGSG
ncbi:globin-coupled sensor protein [Gluconacetobacter takamatsuzukensis]|uniref:Globin-coupled sensor protein n=2 Tax=Gluconacetobacter takamatsuzukensis TaxID=1286190 RepID=A0A7W4KES2_9PROT|nr:globin-coupled sensor protein [Gluconacetobacter takamatsuzukensis]